MAVVFDRTAHKTLWLAIADKARVKGAIPAGIETVKLEILSGMGNGELFPRSNCFACEYGYEKGGKKSGKNVCENCPLIEFRCKFYPYNQIGFLCDKFGGEGGVYLEVFYYACLKIAAWPVKRGVICR